MPEALLHESERMLGFMANGGPVLWVILAVSLTLMTLLVNRAMFVFLELPGRIAAAKRDWGARVDRRSWYAVQIRRSIVAEIQVRLTIDLPVLRALVAICPMLGLVGTVFGMMQVFDALAVTGTGNARAMATGISHATLPTMAGIVVAITGLYLLSMLEQHIRNEMRGLRDSLV